MKALSLRQPWAWLIVRPDVADQAERAVLARAGLFKDVENRSWYSQERGRIWIHAAQALDLQGYEAVSSAFPEIALPTPGEFVRGGIIGSVEVFGCVPPGSNAKGLCNSRWYSGQWGLLLRSSQPCTFIPCKGQLGFFAVGDQPSRQLALPF